jgi:Raf kinase inhibitor-like YbhB/YbcL family protein
MLKHLVCLALTLASVTAHAEDAPSFSLNTNGFLDKGIMPVMYTCDGKDVSPQFSITNIPPKTQSLAFILTDEDAPTSHFYHWVLFNIPASTTELKQGPDKPPAGSLSGMNSFNKSGYNGPCPPKGNAHNYTFTLYALDTKLSLPATANGDAVIAAMKGHIIKETTFSGAYSRWIN